MPPTRRRGANRGTESPTPPRSLYTTPGANVELSIRTPSSRSQPPKEASPRFDPRSSDLLTQEDKKFHDNHHNRFYTDIIATYIIGTKALIQNPSRGRFGDPITPEINGCCNLEFSSGKFAIGIFHIIYMVCVWYEVLMFLNKYYLSGESPIEEIRDKDVAARYLSRITC